MKPDPAEVERIKAQLLQYLGSQQVANLQSDVLTLESLLTITLNKIEAELSKWYWFPWNRKKAILRHIGIAHYFLEQMPPGEKPE